MSRGVSRRSQEIRKAICCTAKQLAEKLGVSSETIFGWEAGSLFPTKRYVEALRRLRDEGQKDATPPKAEPAQSEVEVLEDPEFWRLVSKLAKDAEFRAKVRDLALAEDQD